MTYNSGNGPIAKIKEHYFKGDKIRITGPFEKLHGKIFVKAIYLDGYKSGEILYVCPYKYGILA